MTEEQTTGENQPTSDVAANNSKEENIVRLRKKLEHTERESARKEHEMQQRLDQLQKQVELASRGTQQGSSDTIDPYAHYGIEKDGLVEGEKLIRVLEREKDRMKKEFAKEARQTYEEIEKGRFKERLRNRYNDFDEVMSEDNLALLTTSDPRFARALANIPDEYERRELAYEKIKELKGKEQKQSAQELVDQNKSSAYHYATGGSHSTSSGANLRDFVNNPEAKKRAYEKLRAAQKKGF